MKWTEYYKTLFNHRYWSNEPIYRKTVCFAKLVSEKDKKEGEKMKLSDFIKKYGDCEVTEEMEKCIKKKGKWIPEFGEEFYYVNDAEYVASSRWGNTLTDNYRRDFLRIFRTSDEAFRYVDIMRACKEASFEPDWEDADQNKYTVYYDYVDKQLRISYHNSCNYGERFLFESKEIAQGLIDKLGEKDIAKYVLGVEFED